MNKILIGPRLRQLRRERNQTQAQMAKVLDVSPSYINLLESNQRSLSVPLLMALAEAYGIDWRDLTRDEATRRLATLRSVVQDPVFGGDRPDLQELRGALDHAPGLVDRFLKLYEMHRATLERMMRVGGDRGDAALLTDTPETVIHDFFRNHSNHFPSLEAAAEDARAAAPGRPEDHFLRLRELLAHDHDLTVVICRIDEMPDALRIHDEAAGVVALSQALDHANQVFQLAHVLGAVRFRGVIDAILEESGLEGGTPRERLRIELCNYFAAAYLMPYAQVLEEAAATAYDIDRIAAAFATSFEQVCQRLTTLQREGARGVPFFFLRVDKAGNVTKRFNSTSFQLAEYGGSCPVWNVHTAFYTPGVIMPQFVELPDRSRFFTISRTVHRPVFDRDTQDRRLTLALGCEAGHAGKIGYARPFNRDDPDLFAPIGINCHLCPRQNCSQRAHRPLVVDLPLDAKRRGATRYES